MKKSPFGLLVYGNSVVAELHALLGVGLSSTQSQVTSLDAGRYLRALRIGWPWVVTCTVLGGLLGGLYLTVSPGQATATTLVNINVVTAEPFSFQRNPSSLIDSQTEVQMVRSSAVVSRSAEELGAAYTASDVRTAAWRGSRSQRHRRARQLHRN